MFTHRCGTPSARRGQHGASARVRFAFGAHSDHGDTRYSACTRSDSRPSGRAAPSGAPSTSPGRRRLRCLASCRPLSGQDQRSPRNCHGRQFSGSLSIPRRNRSKRSHHICPEIQIGAAQETLFGTSQKAQALSHRATPLGRAT